jgi:hypothetical protein
MRREEWDRTATICAVIANCNRDPKRRPKPWTPADFHPLMKEEEKAERPIEVGINALKVFVRNA